MNVVSPKAVIDLPPGRFGQEAARSRGGSAETPVGEPIADAAARQLWCAVIINALFDAAGQVAYAEPGERRRIRQQAIEWFLFGGKDFDLVCDLAGLHPTAVRRGALRALADKDLPRIHRGALLAGSGVAADETDAILPAGVAGMRGRCRSYRRRPSAL